MSTPKFRTLYDHEQLPGKGDFRPTKTKQEFKAESDINNILNRYSATGILPDTRRGDPLYIDTTAPELSDFQLAHNLVVGTNERFASLPAKIRDRFANDPVQMLLFLNNDANREEAVTLGLIKPDTYKSASAPPSEAQAATEEEAGEEKAT